MDRNGSIDFNELFNLTETLGVKLTKTEITQAIRELDKDNSGSLSLEEFQPWWRKVLEDRLAGKYATKPSQPTGKDATTQANRLMRIMGISKGGSAGSGTATFAKTLRRQASRETRHF